MKRIDKIRHLSAEELARLIIDNNITDEFCKGNYKGIKCEDDCCHDVECCMKWLEEEC